MGLGSGTTKKIIKITLISREELYGFHSKLICCPKPSPTIPGDATKRAFPTNRMEQRALMPSISWIF